MNNAFACFHFHFHFRSSFIYSFLILFLLPFQPLFHVPSLQMYHLARKHRLFVHSTRCKSPIGQRIKNPYVQTFITSSAHGPVNKSNVYRVRWVIGAAAAVLGAAIFWTYSTTTFESSNSPLHPETFTPFTLVSREAASPTSSIFTLEPTLPGEFSKICSDAWKKGVWSVQLKQPQLQIARSYTPLPPIQAADQSRNLRFLIRWEAQGEVSTYLHKLLLGATVELRGPHIEYTVPDDVDEVVFIAGGTGVAPALQVAYNLFENRQSTSSTPTLRILWANRRRGDAFGGTSDTPPTSTNNPRRWNNFFSSTGPSINSKDYSKSSQSSLVQELEALKERHRGKVTVDYFCDEDSSYITQDVLKQCLATSKISTAKSTQNASMGKRIILLSGPEGFVNYHAGPKTWVGGRELQGSLGGTLKELDPRDWIIWKL